MSDVQRALKQFGGHDDDKIPSIEEELNEIAVDVAIVQGLYFETPSINVTGVRIHRHDSEDAEDDSWLGSP